MIGVTNANSANTRDDLGTLVATDNGVYYAGGDGLTAYNQVVVEVDKAEEICQMMQDEVEVINPKWLGQSRKIRGYSFYRAANVKTFIGGDLLERVCSCAFENAGVQHCQLGRNMQAVEALAFAYCPLEDIYIDSPNMTIQQDAFTTSNAIQTIDIEACAYVYNNCMSNMSTVHHIRLGEGVLRVGGSPWHCDSSHQPTVTNLTVVVQRHYVLQGTTIKQKGTTFDFMPLRGRVNQQGTVVYVPMDSLLLYRRNNSWSSSSDGQYMNSHWGVWADMEAGTTLPTTLSQAFNNWSENYVLTWYSDEKHTIPVTTAETDGVYYATVEVVNNA